MSRWPNPFLFLLVSDSKGASGPGVRRPAHTGRLGNAIFAVLTGTGAGLVFLVLAALVAILYLGAKGSIVHFGFRFFLNDVWEPAPTDVYGIVPFLLGTSITSGLALCAAIPLSLGAAVFLTQHAPLWLRRPVAQLIELLAAIPSIIYGFWALIFVVPVMRYRIEPALKGSLGWTGLFHGTPIGLDLLTASVVLAIMVIPTITAISRDSLGAVPVSQKEAALSLGATDWEVTRRAALPYARSGVLAGIVLGLGRALGETMAVTLVIGNNNHDPTSLFSQAQTIPSLIVNQFLEASGPLELSALIEAGLILLMVALVINVVARTTLARLQRGQGVGQE
jgi:phosphate transport system permease protein